MNERRRHALVSPRRVNGIFFVSFFALAGALSACGSKEAADAGAPATEASAASSASVDAATSAKPVSSAIAGDAADDSASSGKRKGKSKADTPESPVVKALNAAYAKVLGPEPQFSYEHPWPECSTSAVRADLKSEDSRRKAEAQAVHDPLKRAWEARRDKVRQVLRGGVWVAEPAGIKRLESFPEVGKEVKVSALSEDGLAGEFRSAIQAEGGVASVDCKVLDIAKQTRSPSAVQSAAASSGAGASKSNETVYDILCEGPFVLEVAERTAWATVNDAGGKLTVASYQLEADRVWEASLKTKVFTLARGSELKVKGVRRIERRLFTSSRPFPRELLSVDYDGTSVWTLGFEPRCAHEGLGCTFEDAPASIASTGGSCAEPLLGEKDPWLAALDAKKAGASTEPMLSMLDILTSGSAEVRKRLADYLRSNKRFDELVALMLVQKDSAALQSFADEQQKANQPKLAAAAYEGLRKLNGDDADVLAKLGAAYVEANAKGKALSVLRVAADAKTGDAAYQKQVGFLLDAAGDKAASKAALGRACSLGDSEACSAAK
jgi:hypothetical protein